MKPGYPAQQGFSAGWIGKPGAEFVMFDELEERKAPFEVKLTFMNFLLFSYPMCLLLLLDSKPTVSIHFGRWALQTVVGLTIWFLVCHVGLVKGLIRRGMAAILTIILPSAILAGVCQVHAWQIAEKASELVSSDCHSFLQKAELERSWQAIANFRADCMAQNGNTTGLTEYQAALVQDLLTTFSNLDLVQCAGYNVAKEAWEGHWEYLQYCEDHYKCGGWCTAAQPMQSIVSMTTQDSCSLAVGRALSSSVQLIVTQATFYSAMLFLISSILLLVSPRSMAAAY